MAQALQTLDLWLIQVLTAWHAPWLDTLMRWVSASGRASLIWLLLAAVACARPPLRAAAWRMTLTIGLCYGVVDGILKPAVARERPFMAAMAPPRDLPPVPQSASFPSGHAAASAASAVAVSRIWPRARAAWWTLAMLIGYSRIYLGHHYPLDVAGGAAIGLLVALWVLGGRDPATFARGALQIDE